MGRHPYHAAARVYQSGPGWEESERRQQIGGRRAVERRGRVGLGLGRASGVVVVLLRQFLLDLVAPRPPAVVQRGGRAAVVVPLLPRPLPLLVLGVRVLGPGGALGVRGPILAQQPAYAERVAAGRLVVQRSRAGLTRGRGIGALGVAQAAVVAGVIAGAAAGRVRVVHVYLFRRVRVAVAVNRHHLPIQSDRIESICVLFVPDPLRSPEIASDAHPALIHPASFLLRRLGIRTLIRDTYRSRSI